MENLFFCAIFGQKSKWKKKQKKTKRYACNRWSVKDASTMMFGTGRARGKVVPGPPQSDAPWFALVVLVWRIEVGQGLKDSHSACGVDWTGLECLLHSGSGRSRWSFWVALRPRWSLVALRQWHSDILNNTFRQCLWSAVVVRGNAFQQCGVQWSFALVVLANDWIPARDGMPTPLQRLGSATDVRPIEKKGRKEKEGKKRKEEEKRKIREKKKQSRKKKYFYFSPPF